MKHKNKRPRKPPHKHHANASPHLPEICVLTITGTNDDGELTAEPVKWAARKKPPHIVVTESGRSRAAVKGDRVLAKLRRIKTHLYQALVIRVLPSEQPRQVLGVFAATLDGGIIEPISRKLKESFMVARADTNGAEPGELVAGITQPGVPSLGMTYAKITERLGRLDSPRAASLIATHLHELPTVFSEKALAEAQSAPPPMFEEGRADLRDIALVTIDGEDARDFDDAVFAQKTKDGFHLLVAIADVAYYVKEGSALDAQAMERGNSVYFPDRVIPMLPERLSNGLCSLVPNEDRYCLAVHIWIDAHGHMKRYEFVRGIMRSRARLTYEQVEAAITGQSKDAVISNLYEAYKALAHERDARGALNLNLPEYKIVFDTAGNVSNIAPKAKFESHRLIEAYMIAANVAAADFLLKKRAPGIYRAHETPADERLEELRQFLKLSGFHLQKGAVAARHFNHILKRAEGEPNAFMIHTAVLRAQMQAYYSAENVGHFGLSLQKYCHFTSPIRRYSDLVVHRSLVHILQGGNTRHAKQDHARLSEIALHVSDTERKAMMAEREASDRYKVAYMSRQIGNTFSGTIVSLNEYGLFVSLADSGVQGFVPMRNLPGDFFTYDKRHFCFKGARSKQVYRLGQPLCVRVQEANGLTGSLIFALESHDDPASHRSSPPLHHKQKHRRRRR